MESKTVPSWLKALLSLSTFFIDCEHHAEEFKRECNMFCFNCSGNAMCIHCIESSHKDHKFIQIRRSSYRNVVKVLDIENELDITGIQTYVINSFNVVYLNKRDLENPKSRRAGKGCKDSYQCQTCRRNISDSHQFCSLGCKYAWVQKSEIKSKIMRESGSGSTVMGTNKAEGKRKMEEQKITKTWPTQEDKGFSEQIPKKRVTRSRKISLNNLHLQTTDEFDSRSKKNKATSNSNKRKGIPCRAPIF